MELLRPLLTLAVVSLFVVDVRAKLKGDECEGVLLPFHYNADPNRAFFRSMYQLPEQVSGENERARGDRERTRNR